MKPRSELRRPRVLALACLAGLLSSCVTQPIPVHGGGKRFYFEQAMLAAAVDDALAQVDAAQLEPLKGHTVQVAVVSMGDEGGGLEPDRGPLSFGLLSQILGGAGTILPSSVTPLDGSLGGSHAFANARDIQYLLGRIRQFLNAHDIVIAEREDSNVSEAPTVYFLVSEFGTAKTGFNFVVYRENELAARVAFEAFAYGLDPSSGSDAAGYRPLGSGASTATYRTTYLLGFGPLGGAEMTLQAGDVPMRVRRVAPVGAETEVQP
jgi:hypothetical protein